VHEHFYSKSEGSDHTSPKNESSQKLAISMKRIYILILFLSIAGVSSGQDIELFSLEYGRYSGAKVQSNDTLEASFVEYELKALFPAVRQEKFSLLAGGVYRLTVPEGSDRISGSNLFFLAVNVVGSFKLSDKVKLLATAIPALSTTSDTKIFTSDNFLMQGAILYHKKVSDRFTYRFGALSTSRFGSPIIVPSLGLSHQGRRMKLDLNLPFLMSVLWDYKKDFSYGIKLSLNGSQYNVEEETFNGNETDAANFSRIRVGPQIQHRLKGPIVIGAFAGMAVNRTFEFEVVDADDVDFSLENSPFVAVRLSLKPQLNND